MFWSVLKHLGPAGPGHEVQLLLSPCEAMAMERFKKEEKLLKTGETLELWRDGFMIFYVQAKKGE